MSAGVTRGLPTQPKPPLPQAPRPVVEADLPAGLPELAAQPEDVDFEFAQPLPVAPAQKQAALGETLDEHSAHEQSEQEASIAPPPLRNVLDEAPENLKRPARRKRKPGEIVLGPRDMDMLFWILRMRYATADQVARRFSATYMATIRRLRALGEMGFVTNQKIFHGVNDIWLPTPSAAKLVVSPLKAAPSVSLARAAHTLGCTDLATEFELAGYTVATEREIWALARLDAREIAPPNLQPLIPQGATAAERAGAQIPDLVIFTQDGPLAIELELNVKDKAEWKAIFAAYRRMGTYTGGIIYYTQSRWIGAALTRTIEQAGMSQSIRVMTFRPVAAPPLYQIR